MAVTLEQAEAELRTREPELLLRALAERRTFEHLVSPWVADPAAVPWPRVSRYVPHRPTPHQAAFLALHDWLEGAYGGAAGGGKTDAVLMDLLVDIETPGYNAICLRRTLEELMLADAVLARALDWLAPYINSGEVHYNTDSKRFTFVRYGTTLQFAYLKTATSHLRYQGAAFARAAYDETTQFEEYQVDYLFSRLRRPVGSTIPIGLRGATNPGGIGHDWFKSRYVSPEPGAPKRFFIPARLTDNPHLDQEEYLLSLTRITDEVTRNQLELGDWDAAATGGIFGPVDFADRYLQLPPDSSIEQVYIFVDAAMTSIELRDNDEWAVVVLARAKSGQMYLLHCNHGHWGPRDAMETLVALYRRVRKRWGDKTLAYYEKAAAMEVLAPLIPMEWGDVCFIPWPHGNKDLVTRAHGVASFVKAQRVHMPARDLPWCSWLVSQCARFPAASHDDGVAALVGALEVATLGWTGTAE